MAKKENISKLPKSPGVYQFLDSGDLVLYVGKAKNLKSRLKSYYAKEVNRRAGIHIMVKEAKQIKIIECGSEIEAVLLEAELINKLKPKYNVRQKDDKSFSMIEITKEDFPKVLVSRFREIKSSRSESNYFGPYPSGDSLKKSLKYLRKIFPYMDCSERKFNTYKKKDRPCLYGEIDVCTAPCVKKISKKEYRKNINYLKAFLQGGKKNVVTKLNHEMKEFSKQERYEEAAKIKIKLDALGHLYQVAVGTKDGSFSIKNIIFSRVECYDISNIQGRYAVGAMSVFTNGKKDSGEYRKFKIKTANGANDLETLKEIISRRFNNNWPNPDLILVDGGGNQLKVIQNVLKERKLDIPVVSISKGAKRNKNEFHFSDSSTAKYVMKNPNIKKILIQARDEAHRFAIFYYRKLHLKGLFD